MGVGSDRVARQLSLSDLEVEETVFVNDLVHFRFKLTANGYVGKTIGIVLRCAGAEPGGSEGKGEVVARVDVTVAADGHPQQVVIPYRPTKEGQFSFTIDVAPSSPGSSDSRNAGQEPPKANSTGAPSKDAAVSTAPDADTTTNPLTASIKVQEQKIRVLLVDGSPRYEWRYLYNMLSRDQTIELHTFLQEADVEFGDEDKSTFLKSFPVGRENLKKYDVVIFGDVDPSLLSLVSPSALQTLADYVDDPAGGGALVLIAGPNFMPKAYAKTPLARLLPFDPATVREPEPNKLQSEGFVAMPTDLGLANSAMQLEDSAADSQARWKKLPPMYWMVQVSDLKPARACWPKIPRGPVPTASRFR